MSGLHFLDILVILAYLFIVVFVGYRSSKASATQEGYFLAGRKLGKFYQFFLSFGNATEPSGAVSNATLVFQRGVSGVWLAFQTIFMNPYYWFMYVWFRRVRLVTMADLFEDRFGSRGLSRLYAVFQIGVACVFLGSGNFVAYKIASSLVRKPEVQWTAAERQSVASFEEFKRLEKQMATQPLSEPERARLEDLRDQNARGELHSYITGLQPIPFYLCFTVVVGAYIVLGGMTAAALNETLQGFLIIVFSVMLIPVGLKAIGGWEQLSKKVPAADLDLFGVSGSPAFIIASLLVGLVQIHGLSHNMGISGSAKDEYAARSGGVGGTYLKRVMIILWAFAGLIAIAMFGKGGLSDPDAVWGTMSKQLLGPGLVGLMLAGVIAGTMSTLAAKALAVSSLFVRNVFRDQLKTTEASMKAARWAVVGVLFLGVISGAVMQNVTSVVKLILTVNVPFGAAVILIFFWRRLTAQGVWAAVILSALFNLIVPLSADYFEGIRRAPSLTVTSEVDGRPVAVFWEKVVRIDPENPQSGVEGRGRFNLECWLLDKVGVIDAAKLTPTGRETAQFFFDGFFPFVVLIVTSFFTRPTEKKLVDQFYGKMKTPVGPSPEADAIAVEETFRNPSRFDHTKLFGPKSSWEFCKWDRVDTVGFLSCLAISWAIVGLFVLLLKLAANG
jgi:solute:Na+ symporter, SSS family